MFLHHFNSFIFCEFHQQQVENGAFNWSMMPAELRPNWKRKLHTKDGSRKLAKDVNVEETLKALEQKEKTRKTGGAPNEDDDKEDEVSSNFLMQKNVQFFFHIH